MPLSHLIFELAVYLLAALAVWQARTRRGYAAILLAGTLYGILVEYVGLTTRGYHYGPFWVILFPASYPIPLCIPVAWGVILYTTLQTSAYLGHTSLVLRAAISTLLALSLDFVMDPIASGPGGLQMWTWTPPACQPNPLTLHCSSPGVDEIFGVPLGNFVGWYFNILSYAFFVLIGWHFRPPNSQQGWVNLLIALVAAPLALGSNLLWMIFFSRVTQVNIEILFAFTCLMIALLVVLWYAPFFQTHHPLDPLLLAMPIFTYGFFTFWLVVRSREIEPGLLLFTPLMLAMGIILYLWPYRQWFARWFATLSVLRRTPPTQSLSADLG